MVCDHRVVAAGKEAASGATLAKATLAKPGAREERIATGQ